MGKRSVFIVGAVIILLIPPVMSEASDDAFGTASLGDPLQLNLRYPVGTTLYYRLLRHSDMFNMDGSKFGQHEAIAYFSRTRLEDDERGRVGERFTWKYFAFGQSIVPGEPITMSPLKEAEDFSLICSVQDEEILTKFDFSRLPRTLEGLWFMIMSWDAITFDGPVRPQEHFDFPSAAPIGTEVKSTRGAHDFVFAYPPIMDGSSYSFSGNNRSMVLGITRVKDIPCAIIEFYDSGNVIHMNMSFSAVKSESRGMEHFWGKTYLSLEDGSVVKGELVAPVMQTQDLQMPGQSKPERMEYLVMQKLELEILSPAEFESEIKEIRETASDM